jgi:transcriptional regulator with XRE-family HTH domain
MGVDLGERIRQFRLSKKPKLTLKKMAGLIGYSHPHISMIEKGKREPGRDFLEKLKEVFGLSIDEILSGETPERVKPLPSSIEFSDLIGIVEAGLGTKDFLSLPIQTFGSNIKSQGRFLGQVIIHRRVFGRRKTLAAVQLSGGKEIKVVIVGK